MKPFFRFIALGSILLLFGNWGFFAHRISPQLATYYLPKKMQGFFFANLDQLVRDAVRPDVRRNTDPKEAPRHFIDFEAYGDSAAWKIPERWEEASKKYPVDTLLKYGTVPWRVNEMQTKLTEAFRSKNKDSILYYAAELCHYVGDAHVPLHTSLNYDGQLSNQKGIHALWESTLPEMDIQEYHLNHPYNARFLSDPQHAIWQELRDAHVLVKTVFEEERKASEHLPDSLKYQSRMRYGRMSKAPTPLFARRYSQRLADEVQNQLIRTAQDISSFWYTCWVNAGKPDLSAIQPIPKATRKNLKKEERVWKKNQLLAKGMLRAKKEE